MFVLFRECCNRVHRSVRLNQSQYDISAVRKVATSCAKFELDGPIRSPGDTILEFEYSISNYDVVQTGVGKREHHTFHEHRAQNFPIAPLNWRCARAGAKDMKV